MMTSSTPYHTLSSSTMMTTHTITWVWDMAFMRISQSCHPFCCDAILLVVEMTSGISSHNFPFSSSHMDIDTPYSSTLPNDAIRIFSFTMSSHFVWNPFLSSADQSLGCFHDFHMLDAVNFWVQEGYLHHGEDFSIVDMFQWHRGILLSVTLDLCTLVSKYHIDRGSLE